MLLQHDTARRILDKMVQKNDDTDDTIPLAKVSLLIKEKKLPEATQLLQVRESLPKRSRSNLRLGFYPKQQAKRRVVVLPADLRAASPLSRFAPRYLRRYNRSVCRKSEPSL